MRLISPQFWRYRGWRSWLLAPFSLAFWLASKIAVHKTKKVKVPVICVGNVVVGGAGKTPLCLMIGEHLKQQGRRVAFISRGFCGSLSNISKAYRVMLHSAEEVGDEALLLLKVAPTYICKHRYKAAALAVAEGAEVVIMDDGLQHRTLWQDIRLLVINHPYGFGNRMLLPAGPLRTSIKDAVKHSDALVVISSGEDAAVNYQSLGLPTFNLQTKTLGIDKWQGSRVVAFCSIASPGKFKDSLENNGIKLAAFHIFPDHHIYEESELRELIASSTGLPILTTSKDYVKMPDYLQPSIHVVELKLSHTNKLLQYLDDALLEAKG